MDMVFAEKRIKELTEFLNYHAKLYYVDDTPSISDYEYDMNMRELKTLEKEFPHLVTSYSPTQRIGGKVLDGFSTITHDVVMMSLNDVFSKKEVFDFDEKIRESVNNPEYTVEPKIDGLSVSLEYENGVFMRGSTRGDGRVGEDVTQNLKTIQSIPLVLPDKLEKLEVRGEVFISKENFDLINEERELQDEPLFANARNAAAGSLKQLDPQIAAKRKLDIYIFNVQNVIGKTFESHSESLEYLATQGFKVVPYWKKLSDISKVFDYIEQIGEKREDLSFGIDGAVVKLNNLAKREELGSTAKFPRWAVAYKYPPEQKETTLRKIIVQVGRTGVLTPNAEFDTIRLAGTNVSRATLHNMDFISEKDLRIGDKIIVQKAGDIIPEVVRSLKDKRNGSEIEFKMPSNCPICGESVFREDGEAAYRCTNLSCPAQITRNVIHFASRGAMDIEGLGRANVQLLIENGLIKNPADLYYLNAQDILQLPGFAEKSALNLIDAIEKSKSNNLYRLLYGLGIRHIGEKTARNICNTFKSLDEIIDAPPMTLACVDDVGMIMAESIKEFFSIKSNIDLVERLRNAGVNFNVIEENSVIDNRFEGKVFVLTGTLNKYKRDDAKKIIESYGGKVTGSVSGKTTYVLAGSEAGSKLDKAIELGITIISEDEFEEMILQ